MRDCDQRYEARFALIRPDQHVAWRGNDIPTDCEALLGQVTGASQKSANDPTGVGASLSAVARTAMEVPFLPRFIPKNPVWGRNDRLCARQFLEQRLSPTPCLSSSKAASPLIAPFALIALLVFYPTLALIAALLYDS